MYAFKPGIRDILEDCEICQEAKCGAKRNATLVLNDMPGFWRLSLLLPASIRSELVMAFDPVRDAILNSPERTSYANPFEVNGDEEEEDEEKKANTDFKAPDRATAATRTAESSNSPERSTRVSAEIAQTPGRSPPPTPTRRAGNFDGHKSFPERRQSSIFSLLSPEPQASSIYIERSDNHNFNNYIKQEEPEELKEEELAQDQQEGTSSQGAAIVLAEDVKSITDENTPLAAPIKRGRAYHPHGRLNGPAPVSLYTPLRKTEVAFYKDLANCKNPLRIGTQLAGRLGKGNGLEGSLQNGGNSDFKGKSRAVDTMMPQHLGTVGMAPRYRQSSPLDPSLVPDPVIRVQPGPKRDRSSSISPGRKRKRESTSEAIVSGEGSQIAAHCRS